MEQLMRRCAHVYVVSADTPRAATVEQVLQAVEENGQLEHAWLVCGCNTLAVCMT
jgi:signal recognition particle GTPase